jgi:uracil phosphoribosyltransferase
VGNSAARLAAPTQIEEKTMPAPVHVSTHPLIHHKLARLRATDTKPPEFRELVAAISRGLFFEATHALRLQPVTVRTPLTDTTCQQLADRVGLVPVLRAGLGMAEAMLETLPEAVVWHLGLYRDPMLATGGSAIAAIDILKKAGTPRIIFVGLIAAPEGVSALQSAHPEVPIFLAALDSHLNEVGYIVPGLGDAGDRQFGTA